VFLRIIAIFSLYIIILYSVLNTFAVLYSHLSAILNEGIEAEDGLISHLDALYFSATTFFTIGFGDITPSDYSEITKQLVIIQAIIGHILTTVLWPIVIIFVFSNKKKLSELWVPSSIEKP
jgi:voltage-gated potassium channel Kch